MIDMLIQASEAKELYKLIQGATRVVLTCHVRPDGDAVGSTLGLCHLLTTMGKQAKVVTPDQPPKALRFLPGYQDIVPNSRYEDYARKLFNEADLIIGCDFNVPSRLSGLKDNFLNSNAKKVLIDHHEDPQKFTDLMISYPDMSSTCDLVFRLVCEMGLYETLNLDGATCLCTGIITDTRNLSVNCKNLDLYDIVKELLLKGVNKRLILKEALETKSEDALKLCAFGIAEHLKVYPKHRAAIVWLTQEDMDRYHYEKGDTEGLVNQVLEMRGIIYTALIKQDKEKVRLSMRSLGSFPVNRICSEHFGGGGHLQAAGGDYEGSVQDCIKALEACMPAYDTEVQNATKRLEEQGYIMKQ